MIEQLEDDGRGEGRGHGFGAQHFEQGLFAAEGIEVEIASARGGSDVVTKLATNSADFGSAGLASLMQAKAQGEVPVVAVAPIYNKQPDAFFTTEGSGIESFKDIVGKTVATPTFSASNVVWPLLLERNGIDPAGRNEPLIPATNGL